MKFKVWVTDDDAGWSAKDDIEGFVQLLSLTPARSVWTATWQHATIYGQRPSSNTRSTDVYPLCHNQGAGQMDTDSILLVLEAVA